ncbi:phosphotransacetylase family protein [Nodosilinea sp. LEGE 07088]|uniref:phosphotransacetylase family protein n=1 Tax=Nodosilinea sp. LEGE 07088 TaxID=2777968 RepID=UPI0018806C9A|nr:phosphotransacetylase family protein [Nodosilinea sp. LEGE 07088]MBE9139645.1 phosphotransacetylase family protein [Nodosilinea sp. LEGE 07088]
MPSSAKRLVIGSTESYSGKSAVLLGVGLQLQAAGMDIGFGKPIGNSINGDGSDPDLDFIVETLHLPASRYYPPSISLTEAMMAEQLTLNGQASTHGSLQPYTEHQGEALVLLEGPGNLTEGMLLNLSVAHIAAEIDAAVLLVTRYDSLLLVDRLLAAKAQLGSRLIGVIINDVPEDAATVCKDLVRPFLEHHDIPVLALLPRSPIMRSITVREIVSRLNAEVLCCANRLDLMVETLTIGAMNVNSALRYFRKATNMAVVTGGDRTDIQFAALETSTQCLVLTGQIPPSPEILERASDLEVPIVSVDSDTLSTVERIDELFGQVRLHEPIKVQCIKGLIADHFDRDRLLQLLDLGLPVSAG